MYDLCPNSAFSCFAANEDYFLSFFQSVMVVCTRQCSINVVQTFSTAKSITITLYNEDVKCQYSVFVREQQKNSSDCQPAREPSHFECQIENLDPGTWYHMNVTSRRDEKQQMQQTLSLPTSKKSAFH